MTTAAAIDLDTRTGVLAFARAETAAAQAAEVHRLEAAVAWAAMHSVDSMDDAATWPGTEGELALAGPGAPLVAEFAVAELAVALGTSTDAARSFLGEAMELRYRLPKLWARVLESRVLPWRARQVAKQTLPLSAEAAEFVDTHVAGFAHAIGYAALERLIEEALVRFMPAEARRRRRVAAEDRHFDIETHQVSYDGTVQVDGVLDLADALDLNDAIVRGAANLKDLGCEESLDVRRSIAVGDLARRQLALDLNADGQTMQADQATQGGRPARVKPRQVVLYVHLSDAAIAGAGSDIASDLDLDLARVERTRSFVSTEQVRDWCANPDTSVVVKPVIDLNAHVRTDAYEIPDRLRERIVLRDGHCVFPGCTRPARRADIDHITPHAEAGETTDRNLAPLCRAHHRHKTHGGWTYTTIEPGAYLWHTPMGQHALVTDAGTTYVDHPEHRRP